MKDALSYDDDIIMCSLLTEFAGVVVVVVAAAKPRAGGMARAVLRGPQDRGLPLFGLPILLGRRIPRPMPTMAAAPVASLLKRRCFSPHGFGRESTLLMVGDQSMQSSWEAVRSTTIVAATRFLVIWV
jgi:hypothetical protein